MTRKTVAYLAKYYFTNHGAEEYEDTWDNEFNFTFRGYKHRFMFVIWGNVIDIGVDIVQYDVDEWHEFDIDIPYCGVDETNPEFDPEEFFKPLLTRIEEELS